jgi:hypothetical protein
MSTLAPCASPNPRVSFVTTSTHFDAARRVDMTPAGSGREATGNGSTLSSPRSSADGKPREATGSRTVRGDAHRVYTGAATRMLVVVLEVRT